MKLKLIITLLSMNIRGSLTFCTIFRKETEFKGNKHDTSFDCKLSDSHGRGGGIYEIEGLPANLNIQSAVSTLSLPLGVYSQDDASASSDYEEGLYDDDIYPSTLIKPSIIDEKLVLPPGFIVEINQPFSTMELGQNPNIGEKSVLVVRVEAPDANTTKSEAELSDSIFGTIGDAVNLKSQFAACSYDKVNIVPAPDQTTPGPVTDGVVTVAIKENVIGSPRGIIKNAVTDALTNMGFSLPGPYQHIMYCLPPGTSDKWIAYAHVNSWTSVYNDSWCTYVSTQMHEIGHNLNLAHSGEGTGHGKLQYGDRSGMMGSSYRGDDKPVMCFNSVKNWQLGWYQDRHILLNSVSSSWKGLFVGISEYDIALKEHHVIAMIPGDVIGDNQDYYVSFNRKKIESCNSGTLEGANQVLVHKRPMGDSFKTSILMAKLNMGDSYIIGSTYVKVQVSSIDTSITPGVATVEISRVMSPTYEPTNFFTDTPSRLPTKIPTASPTETPTIITKEPTASPTKTQTEKCSSNLECDDKNKCTRDRCVSGSCFNDKIEGCCLYHSQCNDGKSCTRDTCEKNVCVRRNKCNDHNRCTLDVCIAAGRCVFRRRLNCKCIKTGKCTKPKQCCSGSCKNGRCLVKRIIT